MTFELVTKQERKEEQKNEWKKRKKRQGHNQVGGYLSATPPLEPRNDIVMANVQEHVEIYKSSFLKLFGSAVCMFAVL
jgi:hypothetical protein